jgi:hypothetical protein
MKRDEGHSVNSFSVPTLLLLFSSCSFSFSSSYCLHHDLPLLDFKEIAIAQILPVDPHSSFLRSSELQPVLLVKLFVDYCTPLP